MSREPLEPMLDLARHTTGRGGSGTPAARAEQQAIIEMLTAKLRE